MATKLAQTISHRITWVTSTKSADRRKKTGWQAHCENCKSDQFYRLDEYELAQAFALNHKCYADKNMPRPSRKVHHNETLRSESSGIVARG